MTNFAKTADQIHSHDSEPRVESRSQWYHAALLIVIVVTTYLSVPLVAGGRLLVPSFPTVMLCPLLFIAVWPSVSTSDIVFTTKVALLLVLSIALSPGLQYADQKFLGLIQFVMALMIALAVVRLMLQLRPSVLERALLLLWVAVVFGSMLEVLDVIRGVSDSFRAWAYSGTYTLYEGLSRDINMVGWLRPKLFSVEPSHVTKLFVSAVNSWLLIRVTWGKVWITIGATLIMLTIMGSPMLLASAAITVAVVFWNQNANFRTKGAMVVAALLVAGLFGTFYEGSRFSVIAERLQTLGESTPTEDEDLGSEEQRVVYPYMALVDTWMRWPFFGVGIGGKEVIFEHSAFSFEDPNAAIGNNAFTEAGIYLGLFGTLLFIYAMARGARQTGVSRLGLLALIIVLFSQLMGGVLSFRYWGYIALLWGALAVADSLARRTQEVSAVK